MRRGVRLGLVHQTGRGSVLESRNNLKVSNCIVQIAKCSSNAQSLQLWAFAAGVFRRIRPSSHPGRFLNWSLT
jgi:hypothetical protein